jgi:hypothetical protein
MNLSLLLDAISTILKSPVVRIRKVEKMTELWVDCPLSSVTLAQKEELLKLGEPDNIEIQIGEICPGTKFLMITLTPDL